MLNPHPPERAINRSICAFGPVTSDIGITIVASITRATGQFISSETIGISKSTDLETGTTIVVVRKVRVEAMIDVVKRLRVAAMSVVANRVRVAAMSVAASRVEAAAMSEAVRTTTVDPAC